MFCIKHNVPVELMVFVFVIAAVLNRISFPVFTEITYIDDFFKKRYNNKNNLLYASRNGLFCCFVVLATTMTIEFIYYFFKFLP